MIRFAGIPIWRIAVSATCAALAAGIGAAQASAAESGAVGVPHTHVVHAPAKAADPYAPGAAPADRAVFLSPSGATVEAGVFYLAPHREFVEQTEASQVDRLRIFFNVGGMRKGTQLEFLFGDFRLIDRESGEEFPIPASADGVCAWEPHNARVGLEAGADANPSELLRLAIDVDPAAPWPGMQRPIGGADWAQFGELRLRLKPLRKDAAAALGVEYYTTEGEKVQKSLSLEAAPEGEWKELAWRFDQRRPKIRFAPEGDAAWAARLLSMEAGLWTLQAAAAGSKAPRLTNAGQIEIAPAESDGIVRVSPRDPRYLEFDSGKPYFPIGINLLGSDLAYYDYFLQKLAANGGNFIRIWLSPRTMGIELRGGQFEQDRSAQLDALLERCRRLGIYVMLCLTDFREADTGNENSYWAQSPINRLNGGACDAPEEFFSSEEAKALYKKKLRYTIDRWSAYPSVMAWEFFNEVNITDGWRKTPEIVRDWHREMAEFVKSIDPYGHIVTSSFAGLEDDPLWEQSGMEIAQRHFYLTPGPSFVETSAAAYRSLERHAKPVLIGEFGRRKNWFAEIDAEGSSLHNGLWASAMAGCCGAAMSWWWQWIDDHGLWRQFAILEDFVRGVDWPGEGFEALRGELSAAEPAEGFGPWRLAPGRGGFNAAPYNEPIALAIDPASPPDASLLGSYLHGVRNHPDLHNPVTFHVEYARAGEFAVSVADVSLHGGAGLLLTLDGAEAMRKDFPNSPDAPQDKAPYLGRHAIPVPAGRHTIRVENPGADWLLVGHYEFQGLPAPPPLRLIGLRGEATALAWLWNSTAVWDREIRGTALLPLNDVEAALQGFAPGSVWRVRPFDPWTGEWGGESEAKADAAGQIALRLDSLERDWAWRLETRPY